MDENNSSSLGKNVSSKYHHFIVIHGSVRRRKRNLIRSNTTSTRHLKLQPDLQSENTAHIPDVGERPFPQISSISLLFTMPANPDCVLTVSLLLNLIVLAPSVPLSCVPPFQRTPYCRLSKLILSCLLGLLGFT